MAVDGAAANENPVRLSPYARSVQANLRRETPVVEPETIAELAASGNRPNQRALRIAEVRLQEGRTEATSDLVITDALVARTINRQSAETKRAIDTLKETVVARPGFVERVRAGIGRRFGGNKETHTPVVTPAVVEAPVPPRRAVTPREEVLVKVPVEEIRPGTTNEQVIPPSVEPVAQTDVEKAAAETATKVALGKQATRAAEAATEALRVRKGFKKPSKETPPANSQKPKSS